EIGTIRATRAGTGETSYYPALATLLNEIGKTLAPKVSCVIQLQNRGAGLPDGGLFTADQCRHRSRAGDGDLFSAQTPSRGVIEAKSPRAALPDIVGSEQVERYWKRYGMVLVTNFRAFALVGKDSDGRPRELETFELAPDEAGFWALAAHPRKTADEQGERMQEYLKRVLLHNAPLAAPQDVAGLLASYAHDARLRVERADLPALASLRQALEQALGLRFEGGKGEHFFRSTLVQTLFYGVFSAWVLWSRRRAARHAGEAFAAAVRENADTYRVAGAFDWRSAHFLLRVPMLRALFVQVADPARLGALGLIEVLDWAAAALNRVDRDAFFASFDEGHAVQYFYEPFLQAFDPDLRNELGVWYTPTEIVDYQVERVDRVLRDELDIPDGLADPRVVVLDPCCGTGAYVRAVLERIARTLHDKGGDGLIAQDLKSAAIERVLGFEIMPAPFVIAHLQIGLLLETLGAPLNDARDERAGVFLTNALTGWEPPKEPKTLLLFPEMAEERDAADHIKRRDSILVILGNPPYNGYAGVAVDEERGLSDAYRTARRAPQPQGQGLNDLYIRFFRMAERRIVEMNRDGRGVVSFISNYSWLDG
ncbi:MAG: N-6 DNA methylase, partial [Lentisphaerae bacterium]|nr:N-6 DNA methylase [Lentisphaerota bacterium]